MSKTSHYHIITIIVETEKPMKDVGGELARRICMHADVHDATIFASLEMTAAQWDKTKNNESMLKDKKRDYIGQKHD